MSSGTTIIQRRQQLLSLYHSALQAVNGEQAVSSYLQQHPISDHWAVLALGKAACAMARGAQQVLADRVKAGLAITAYGYADPQLASQGWVVKEAGHPLPDEASLEAGELLLHWLEQLEKDIPLLVLLSGGASALVEVPVEGITLDALRDLNSWLLASGLDITQMNPIRQRFSRIKGGRLAHYLRGRPCLQLLISDVPGDDPAVIASAPLVPVAVVNALELPEQFRHLLQHDNPLPGMDDSIFTGIETQVVASNSQARQIAAKLARDAGWEVTEHEGYFQGRAEELAAEFVQTLKQAPPGIHIWGGESTVVLPKQSGSGGRSQHLALAAAKLLREEDNILLLAAGTDGRDGNSEAAGALVDGATRQRGEQEGESLEQALYTANSGAFLEASGDLIETGPTGTNVMDLVIGWKWA